MVIKIDQSCALLIVDMQNDFMTTGKLPVPDSDEIVPALNKYINMFVSNKLPIFATRDWHPPNHISFKQRGGPWPMHCVKYTRGAEFYTELRIPRNTKAISKGYEHDKEARSSFEGTELTKRLEQNSTSCLLVGGIATEFCVKNTVLDALDRGFDVILLEDAVKEMSNGDKAIKEMKNRYFVINIINFK